MAEDSRPSPPNSTGSRQATKAARQQGDNARQPGVPGMPGHQGSCGHPKIWADACEERRLAALPPEPTPPPGYRRAPVLANPSAYFWNVCFGWHSFCRDACGDAKSMPGLLMRFGTVQYSMVTQNVTCGAMRKG